MDPTNPLEKQRKYFVTVHWKSLKGRIMSTPISQLAVIVSCGLPKDYHLWLLVTPMSVSGQDWLIMWSKEPLSGQSSMLLIEWA